MKNQHTSNVSAKRLNYVVGEERLLRDVITETEVIPLLRGAVRAGARAAALADAEGTTLWSHAAPTDGGEAASLGLRGPAILLEGEPVGSILVKGERGREEFLKGIAVMLTAAVNLLVGSNLKRMLTTEIHTTVVNQSYEELLETNRKLTASEARYRELAESLEIKVEERTAELKKALARLLQQEKLASVGQLAAGIAHEINNPMGFVTSNIRTMQKYAGRFVEMLQFARDLFPVAGGGAGGERFAEKWRQLKLDMVLADVDELVSQSLGGAERVKKIVADLKGFSHIDDLGETVADLNAEIDRTLAVLVHEIPAGTEIAREYGSIPGLSCRAGELCQVFLNIIMNACQARSEGLRLTIRTALEGDAIAITITDNGPGILPELLDRVFEPFFTTKPVGQGMGMGLAVAHEVVTAHGGTVEAGSTPEGGASFVVRLPVTGG
ncbi:histidine kinase [Geobacter metallireducens RCH3]|uniref:histidine kinase n=1 Tax=Geobacter metallireducens (strain ATCC 53774 / DSM 7210 / GS-15) TaxID=269799 RepID=Q39PZ2_GEOMG|nr:ATP-binding protein [Geobacter metallireducens]ABB33682.2 sensor histidine kinase [Geobacter metallireducens GS-15]EHP85378.1 histidine kinase [Geobacter metallireducens RCH3]